MNTKFFNPREKDWFEFVINNRMDIDYLEKYRIHNHNKDNKFDIVFGEIADGKIARIANDIKKSKYTITDIHKSLILPKNGIFYGNQYSFHTEKSLSCINNISYDTINSIKEERRLIYYEKRCKRIYELCNRNHC